MIPIHFQANYLPNHRVFRVSVKLGNKKKITERMSISKFIRFANSPNKPMVINGITIKVEDDDGSYLAPIWAYFKLVADSYVQTTWGKSQKIQNN